MTQFLVILALSVFLLCLAFLGLAVKTLFKKDGQLTTCSGGGSGEDCGCGTQASSCANTK
jgi:hypothetical protein